VGKHKMKEEAAEREIAAMRAVLETLLACSKNP